MATKRAQEGHLLDDENDSNIAQFSPDTDAILECEHNLKFMRRFPDESMNLVVTSPPYNMGKSYERRISKDRYIEEQEVCIAEAVRLLSPKGSICWQVGNFVNHGEIVPLDIILYPIFKQHGLQLRNRIIWMFGHGLHCQKRFSGRYETILWFTKMDDHIFNLDPVRIPSKYPDKKYFKGPKKGQISGNPSGKNPSDVWENPSDVWDIPNVKCNHVEKTDHPCQFPIGLIERLVLALTNKGDRVLDPYLGAGSTAIAALKHGRYAYGCDLEQSYIDIAWNRIHQLRSGTLRIRPMNKPVYQPRSLRKVMKLAFVSDNNCKAGPVWEHRGLKNWLINVFEAPTIEIAPRCTPVIRNHVENEFRNRGWALNVQLQQKLGLTVFAVMDNLAFQLQTGNMSRAPYDLLKLQYLFQSERIEAAALALPTKESARAIGDNIAHAERVINELELFCQVITVPIIVLAFE